MLCIWWIQRIYFSISFVGLKAHKKEAVLSSPVPLNFGRQERSGEFDMGWLSANLFSTATAIAPRALTQQTCLLCDTAEMSAVSYSRHVWCVTQLACLLCHTAALPAASHIRRVCHVTPHTLSDVSFGRQCLFSRIRHCLLSDAAETVCCVTQQTLPALSHGSHCMLCHATAYVCGDTQQTSSAV